MPPIKIAIVGVGKIARDQHIPVIAASPDFTLVCAASRNATVDGVPNFTNIDDMLSAFPDIQAVALCTPPQDRHLYASSALARGKHVLLEKPPGSTLSEVEGLVALAKQHRRTLFATWHSRFAPAVEAARAWLSTRNIASVRVVWKEDVRHWHPGQEWIWQPGGTLPPLPAVNKGGSVLTQSWSTDSGQTPDAQWTSGYARDSRHRPCPTNPSRSQQ